MERKKTKGASRIKKGAEYACDECGMVVTISKPCGCVDACDLICCGEPMKPKRRAERGKK